MRQRSTRKPSRIRDDLTTWESLTQRASDTRELATMLEAEPDDAMTADLEKELRALEKEIGRRQIDLLFNDPYTDHVALIGIHAGAGRHRLPGLGADAAAHVPALGRGAPHAGRVPRGIGRG